MYCQPLAELVRLGLHLGGPALASGSPRDLLALTAIVLVGLAVALLAAGTGAAVITGPLTGRSVALRDKAWSAGYQRLLDPAAPGRARPRAPSAAPAAA
jgi:Family of unknown function (DUF6412)